MPVLGCCRSGWRRKRAAVGCPQPLVSLASRRTPQHRGACDRRADCAYSVIGHPPARLTVRRRRGATRAGGSGDSRGVGVLRLSPTPARSFSGAMSRPAGPRRWQPGHSAKDSRIADGQYMKLSVRQWMHGAQRPASGGCPRSRSPAVLQGSLIAGSVIALAAFNAGLPAARERMVWTDPGSLSAASVARTRRGRQSGVAASARVARPTAAVPGSVLPQTKGEPACGHVLKKWLIPDAGRVLPWQRGIGCSRIQLDVVKQAPKPAPPSSPG